MSFPPTLDNIERKYLHHLAGQLGLVSKSRGKGEGKRFITVAKKKKGGGDGGEDAESLARYAPLKPTPPSLSLLSQHCARFPLRPAERGALSSLLPPSAEEEEEGEEEVWEARVVERLLLPPAPAGGGGRQQQRHRKGAGSGGGGDAQLLQKRAADHAAAQVT